MKLLFLRLFCVLFCLLLALSSCAAPKTSVPSVPETDSQTLTAQPLTTQPLTTQTEPKPDAKALYAGAVEKLKGTFVSATVSAKNRKAFGAEDATKLTSTELVYDSYLTENEKMKSVTTMANSDYKSESVYLDSVFYSSEGSSGYKMAMDFDTYSSRRIPIQLFSSENYAVIEAEEQSDGGYLLKFSSPTKPETYWGEAMSLFSISEEDSFEGSLDPVVVEGEAKLNRDGALTENTVRISMASGRFYCGLEITVEVTQRDAVEVLAPEKAEEYLLLEEHDFDPVGAMDDAFAYLIYADNASFALTEVHAASVWQASYQKELEYQFSRSKELSSCKESVSASVMGDTASAVYEDSYRDGAVSYNDNGERGTQELSFLDLHQLRLEDWAQVFPTSKIAQIDAVDDADIAWQIDFTLDEVAKDGLLEINMSYFTEYSVEEILQMMELEAPSDFVAKGSLFLSKDDLVPLSLFLEYSATAPYQGTDYVFAGGYSYRFVTDYAAVEDLLWGEETPEEDPDLPITPPLFEITGKNGEKLWLMGTVHVGDARTEYLPKEVTDAFDASDALAVEYNVVDFEKRLETDAQLAADYLASLSYTDGTKVKDHLGEESYEHLSVWNRMFGLSDQASLNTYFFYQYFSSKLTEKDPYLSSYDGVDRALIARADKAAKPIWNIESSELHVGTPEGYDDAIQEYLLKELFETDSLVNNTLALQFLYEAWCAGDMEALEVLVEESEDEEASEVAKRYNALMTTQRNAGMLEKAKEYLQSNQVVFFAVGTAHLLGEDGLLATLAEAGYTVTPVAYASAK